MEENPQILVEIFARIWMDFCKFRQNSPPDWRSIYEYLLTVHTKSMIITKLADLFTRWIDIEKLVRSWTRYKCSTCTGYHTYGTCIGIYARLWVRLPLFTDKENSHNSHQFSDDQSMKCRSTWSRCVMVYAQMIYRVKFVSWSFSNPFQRNWKKT